MVKGTSKFFTSKDGPPPRRAPKHKPDPLENHADYLKLRNYVLSGKMKPQEVAGVQVGPEDVESTGVSQPWRVMRDHLRQVIREAHLESDFRILAYKTDSEGLHWAITATYEPPITKR